MSKASSLKSNASLWALEPWQITAKIKEGALFRVMNRHGQILDGCRHLPITVPHVSSRGRIWIIIFFLSLITAMEASDFTTKHEASVSNGSACGDCHQAPQLGGSSPTTVRRIGHLKQGRYVPGPNGGLAHSRSAGQPSIFTPASENIRGLRVSLNLLGDGYVEAVPDEVLRAIAVEQRRTTKGVIHGQPVAARVMEAGESV